jgi:hypothetical protein
MTSKSWIRWLGAPLIALVLWTISIYLEPRRTNVTGFTSHA